MRAMAVAATLAAAVPLLSCASIPGIGPRRTDVWAFVAPWDSDSRTSGERNAARVGALVTGWVVLDSLTGQPSLAFPDAAGRDSASETRGRRMMLVTSWAGDQFHPRAVLALAADTGALGTATREFARLAREGGYRGVILDFEGHSRADVAALGIVVRAFGRAARRVGAGPVAVAVPAADTAAYPARAFLTGAEFVMPMLYDEHWATSSPGAIASPEWVRRSLAVRVAESGASRVVAALPLYGYMWRNGALTQTVGYLESRAAATRAGVALERDAATSTLRATRAGEWDLWVADAVLLQALMREVERAGVRTVALWRLGLEDPAIWTTVLARGAERGR